MKLVMANRSDWMSSSEIFADDPVDGAFEVGIGVGGLPIMMGTSEFITIDGIPTEVNTPMTEELISAWFRIMGPAVVVGINLDRGVVVTPLKEPMEVEFVTGEGTLEGIDDEDEKAGAASRFTLALSALIMSAA